MYQDKSKMNSSGNRARKNARKGFIKSNATLIYKLSILIAPMVLNSFKNYTIACREIYKVQTTDLNQFLFFTRFLKISFKAFPKHLLLFSCLKSSVC